MIDHPNMSYCQFENTARAIDQLMTNMQEALDSGKWEEFLDSMNQYEREAYDSMAYKCRELQNMLSVMEDREYNDWYAKSC